MQQPNWKNHDIPFPESLHEDSIGRRHKTCENASLSHQQHLGGGRVSVKGNHTAGGEVEAGDRDAEAVGGRELGVEGRRDGGLDDVGCVPRDAKAGEDEVIDGDARFLLAGVAGGGVGPH